MAGSKKTKRATPIPTAAAMSRLDLILSALEKETRAAIWAKAALEVGNNIVMTHYHGRKFEGANCYNVLRNGTQTALILALCKLFEAPRARQGQSVVTALNRSDLASIPVFLHLLRQERCRSRLLQRASAGWAGDGLGMSKRWTKDCLAALNRCDETTRRLKSAPGRKAMKTLAGFRDDHVAHLYAQPRPWNANRYNELFLLLDIAAELVSHASVVFRGCNLDLRGFEELWTIEARAFWMPALSAAIVADPFTMENAPQNDTPLRLS